jgi:hypothetical protein
MVRTAINRNLCAMKGLYFARASGIDLRARHEITSATSYLFQARGRAPVAIGAARRVAGMVRAR